MEVDCRLAVQGILTDVELVVRMDILYIHKLAMGSWQMLSEKSAWGLFIFTGWQWDPGRLRAGIILEMVYTYRLAVGSLQLFSV